MTQNHHGYICAWKPIGPTSFQIVDRIRKASGIKKVGHGGTLDPNAEGILPILLGQGTRMNQEFDKYAKKYEAEILLGTTTNTLDSDGEILSQTDASHITITDIQDALSSFRGEIDQQPPMFSAVKYNGQRLYNLARKGITVKRKPRKVMVYEISITKLEGSIAYISILCGKGTYVRSISDELGKLLQVGATLQNLKRVEYGPFNQDNAKTINQIEQAFKSKVYEHILPLSYLFKNWRSVTLSISQHDSISHGIDIEIHDHDIHPAKEKPNTPVASSPQENQIYALSPAGNMAAILTRKSNNYWHPSKVVPI
tara:strand:+ start:1463 stop:2398 length:936 start_codon:yes stop_codon:yes gene_type:complete